MQEPSPKGRRGLAEARSTGSAPGGTQGCQSDGLSWLPPGLIAVEVGLVLLPCVGGNVRKSRLCFSDLGVSVRSRSFEVVFFVFL